MASRPKQKKTKVPGIYKLTYPSGQVRYRVISHRDGKYTTETFHVWNDAVKFKTANDSSHDTKGLPHRNKQLMDTTVSRLVDVYLNGGEVNGRQIQGGISSRGKLLRQTQRVALNKFDRWLKAKMILL